MTLSLFCLNCNQLPTTTKNSFSLFYSQVSMGFSAWASSLFLTEWPLVTIVKSCYITLLTLLKPPTHCCCLAIRPTASLKVTLSLFRRQIFPQTLTTSSQLTSPLAIHSTPSNQNFGYVRLALCRHVPGSYANCAASSHQISQANPCEPAEPLPSPKLVYHLTSFKPLGVGHQTPSIYTYGRIPFFYMQCCLVVLLTNKLLDINFLSHFLVSHNILPFYSTQLFFSPQTFSFLSPQTFSYFHKQTIPLPPLPLFYIL